jgi:hypothetical protein
MTVARLASQVDWRRPWLHPFGKFEQRLQAPSLATLSLPDALNCLQSAPVQFIPQSALPDDQAYEAFIFKTGQIPTRDNLHDFFNGLCWTHFPKTKKRLNELQAAQIAQDGITDVRGPVRDALTLFDENAAFLCAPDALWDTLVCKDWQSLFIDQRALWQQAQLVLFGHALLEKLVSPRKAITAHVYRVWPTTESVASLDSFVAFDLSAEKLATKPFAHLPVLGVPGWWPENENPDFYDDISVFRSPRAGPKPCHNLTIHKENS